MATPLIPRIGSVNPSARTAAQHAIFANKNRQFYPVSPENNQVNAAGVLELTGNSRAGQIINGSIAANTTLNFPVSGASFYFIALSAPISARPRGGVFALYTQGTGQRVDPKNLFDVIELANPTALPIAYSMFVGFGDYIDNRVIIANGLTFNAVNNTYGTTGSLATITIPDLAGSPFTDVNGRNWIALRRSALLMFNLDLATVQLLQRGLPAAIGGPVIAAVQPQTSITLQIDGNFRYTVNNSAMVDAYVSEVYESIPAP
jgi:hypothetical protein